MGLYSTNRVSGLTEATDIELVPDSSFGDIMECNIQLCEHERMMFESLIELDFVSATNEAVLTEAEAEEKNKAADGEKKVKIGEKVAQVIDNAIAAIKKAFANFIAKFQQISVDRVVKKYSDALKKDGALNGFKGIEDFAMPIGFAFSDIKYNSKKSEVEKSIREDIIGIINNLNNCKTTEEVNKVMDEVKNIFLDTSKEDDTDKEDDISDYFKKKEASFIPSQEDVASSIDFFQKSPEKIRDAKKQAADITTILNKIKREIKRNCKTGNNELDLAISKAKYDLVILFIKQVNKYSKKDFEMAKKQIAAYRRLIIICGKYALKNGNSKSTDTNTSEETVNSESALDYIIGESSDQYVYNVFAN